MESLFWFIVFGIAVWRGSALLVYEDGPFDIFRHFRALFGAEPELVDELMLPPAPQNVVGKALLCMWCTSFWVALPFALRFLPLVDYFIGYWLALSGFAIFAEHMMKVLKNWQCDTC